MITTNISFTYGDRPAYVTATHWDEQTAAAGTFYLHNGHGVTATTVQVLSTDLDRLAALVADRIAARDAARAAAPVAP